MTEYHTPNDAITLMQAISRVRDAMSILEELNDEYIFVSVNDQYQTLDDIQIELTNTLNNVKAGEFDNIEG